MKKFTAFQGKVAYLPLDNIDTDMLIPKQHLKTVKKSGLGQYLFSELRYTETGVLRDNFILNQIPDVQILVTGDNFGCGSSREHAPWALVDFGIRVIIAPSFADIFYNNAFKNGLLLVRLSASHIKKIMAEKQLMVDLEQQRIATSYLNISFDVEVFIKDFLLKGNDEIDTILTFKDEISAFEDTHFRKNPWLKGG